MEDFIWLFMMFSLLDFSSLSLPQPSESLLVPTSQKQSTELMSLDSTQGLVRCEMKQTQIHYQGYSGQAGSFHAKSEPSFNLISWKQAQLWIDSVWDALSPCALKAVFPWCRQTDQCRKQKDKPNPPQRCQAPAHSNLDPLVTYLTPYVPSCKQGSSGLKPKQNTASSNISFIL